jgi:hypothetical protein
MAGSFSGQQTVCERVSTREDGAGRRDVMIRLLPELLNTVRTTDQVRVNDTDPEATTFWLVLAD